jgi:vitamin B12 transporter
VKADVIVSAEAVPAEASTVGVAATVIGPEEIARSNASSAIDLLRTVPGLDIAQSGGPGKVASAFLRGTNSNQVAVLVDGVKWNSPYFGGVDLSTLPVNGIEKIEVVRGPFSALYGSDAVGGVIQIFTKRGPAAPGYDVTGSLSAGNAGSGEGEIAAGYSSASFSVTGSYRQLKTDGDLPNDAFSSKNYSARLEAQASENLRLGVTFRREQSESGIPFTGETMTPYRKTTVDMTSVAVPVSLSLGRATTLEGAFSYSADNPLFEDPEDPWGFTRSEVKAHRAGGRAVLTTRSSWNRISVGADYEKASVWNEDSYGLQLDDVSTRTWAVFVEDRADFFQEKLTVTAGIRRDDHSAFGSAWNPRLAVSYRLSGSLRLRAAGGTAFRAPTTGELFYPFSGNADLAPENSTSYEAGLEWKLGAGAYFETSVFYTDVEDLIQYDFAAQKNTNVGRARMQGVEAVVRGDFSKVFSGRVSYTYLDAEDRDSGLPLLRRPQNKASATVGASLSGNATFEVTGMYVGERDDVDAQTFLRVTSPSYFRTDVALTGPVLWGFLSPFVRVNNVFGVEYSEVAGYPSPGRRYMAGLEIHLH